MIISNDNIYEELEEMHRRDKFDLNFGTENTMLKKIYQSLQVRVNILIEINREVSVSTKTRSI